MTLCIEIQSIDLDNGGQFVTGDLLELAKKTTSEEHTYTEAPPKLNGLPHTPHMYSASLLHVTHKASWSQCFTRLIVPCRSQSAPQSPVSHSRLRLTLQGSDTTLPPIWRGRRQTLCAPTQDMLPQIGSSLSVLV